MSITKAEVVQVYRLFLKLPDDKHLEKELTSDQLWEFIEQRAFREVIAECWSAWHKGLDNPLPALVRKGIISRTGSKICWVTIERYQFVWNLIFLSESDLRKTAKRLGLSYPFTSALELFNHIVQDEANREYEVCLEPHITIPSRTFEDYFRKAAKELGTGLPDVLVEITDSQLEKMLLHQSKTKKLSFWTLYTWAVLHRLAASDKDIRRNLNNHHEVLARLLELDGTQLHSQKSIVWDRGQKGIGKQGGYFFPDRPVDKSAYAHFDFNQPILPQICNIS